jgi:hypothetical protein
VCCYNRCYRNDVKGFWAVWDNIYIYDVSVVITVPIVLMLRDFWSYGTIFIFIMCLLL